MRRFLVVGCGGSGAETLAYMMDQLRSDLGRHNRTIPAGWQFVSLDVPTGPGPTSTGVPSVRDQGGSYLGTAPQGEKYSVLDNAVSIKLKQRGRLESVASWAPRRPETVPVPVTNGAGQFRAIGRMITLNQVTAVRERLLTAWENLHRPNTVDEMAALRIPGGGGFDRRSAPVVLVVSSMAGGSGASMALDVCRLLTTIPGLDPATIGVFMASADVFDSLGSAATSGVRPNGLAMFGEIVAAQLGSARDHDADILAGVSGLPTPETVVPFARVFPVSRTMGEEFVPFGDGTPGAVYRGLARGLAALMMSEKATKQLVEYDLTNSAGLAGEREYLGWGAEFWDNVPWGSYGFACLSMGRDRYAEYAAQRLARSCVDRLLDGHVNIDDNASDEQQIDVILDSQWRGVLARTGLGSYELNEKDVAGWLTGVLLPGQPAEQLVDQICETVLRPAIPNPDGRQAKQWTVDFAASVHNPDVRDRLRSAAERAAHAHAYGWYPQVLIRIEEQVTQAICTIGLPYATALLRKLISHVGDNLRVGLEDLTRYAPPDVSAPPESVNQTLRGLRGRIQYGAPVVDDIVRDYRPNIRRQLYAALAAKVAELTIAMRPEVLNPLLDALNDPHVQLRAGRTKSAENVGLAVLATDRYAAWPSDETPVPVRFEHADNEVTLTEPHEYPAQYIDDLRRSIADDADSPPLVAEALPKAAQAVITGQWKTLDGTAAPSDVTPLIERLSEWRPKAFVRDPVTGEQLPPPSSTRYTVHLRAGELLDRARAFVGRYGYSFAQFVQVSLQEFVDDPRLRDTARVERRAKIAASFAATLQLARPLSSVSTAALNVLHPGQQLQYRFKFSDVPFANRPVGAQLRAVLDGDKAVTATSVTAFEESLTDEDGVTRIDIFGSYPNYSPLVYRTVLDPAAQQWAASTPGQRTDFWKWRRARSLPASLPMSDPERRAMTRGWLLGLVLGSIWIPTEPFTDPVRVWDNELGYWLDFPNPLLTPPGRMLGANDWLPAVLESILLAMAHSHDAPVMSSMWPYRALRRIDDDSDSDPAQGKLTSSSETAVTEWLRSGQTRSGLASVVDIGDAPTVVERAEQAVAWLEVVRGICEREYLAPRIRGVQGGASRIDTRAKAADAALFHDVAPDVHRATEDLIDLIQRCVPLAERPFDDVAPGTTSGPAKPEVVF